MERKLLSTLDDEDLPADLVSLMQEPRSARFISRVVVLHNDKLETFSDDATCGTQDFFDTPEFWSGSITWW
jgi:hypothetical protein